jgi:hypothetical protein
MLEIKVKEKNDESITFRLPKSLKERLPGALIEPKTGIIRFKDGHAIGDLFRQLTELYTSGAFEKQETENRKLHDIIDKNLKQNQRLIYKIEKLKAGATALLTLMSIVKPTQAQRNKVNMNDITNLNEVL